jgi:hypothetical protein
MSKQRSQTKRRYKRRGSKKMRGGALSQSEVNQLKNFGFSDYQIETLQDFDVTIDYVMNKINDLEGENGFTGNSDELVDYIMDQIHSEQMEQGHNGEDDTTMSIETQNTNGTMDMDELNVSQNSMDNYTTDEEDMSQTFGGKRKTNKRKTNKRKTNKRKTNKRKTNKRKTKQSRKSRKRLYRGGKGFTTTATTNPIQYKEDEYDQYKNMLNYTS